MKRREDGLKKIMEALPREVEGGKTFFRSDWRQLAAAWKNWFIFHSKKSDKQTSLSFPSIVSVDTIALSLSLRRRSDKHKASACE